MAERPTSKTRYAPLTFDNIANRMTLTKAAKLIHKNPKALRSAIERGELACIKFADEDRVFVTQELITEWVTHYCVLRKDPSPT